MSYALDSSSKATMASFPKGKDIVDLTEDDYEILHNDFIQSPSKRLTPSRIGLKDSPKPSFRSSLTRSSVIQKLPSTPPRPTFGKPSTAAFVGISPSLDIEIPRAENLSGNRIFSSWSFPLSNSPESEKNPNTPSSTSSRRSSKRKSPDFQRPNSETPTKRRRGEIIDMSSDNEEDYVILSRHHSMEGLQPPSPYFGSHRGSIAANDDLIFFEDLDSEDEDEDEDERIIDLSDEEELAELRTQTPEPEPESRRKKSKSFLRDAPLEPPFAEIMSKIHNGMTIKPSDTVELLNGDFLKIKSIVENMETGAVVLRGWTLVRTSTIMGILGNKLNEVCFLLDYDKDDPRQPLQQCIEDVPLDNVAVLRKLIETNQSRDIRGFNKRDYRTKGADWIKDHGELFCRWIYRRNYATGADRKNPNKRPGDSSVESLREGDSTPGEGVDDEVLRMIFNNNAICGGSSEARREVPVSLRRHLVAAENSDRPSQGVREQRHFSRAVDKVSNSLNTLSVDESPSRTSTIDLTGSHGSSSRMALRDGSVASRERFEIKPSQKYTVVDAFCGGGGISRGAKAAGFDCICAVDNWDIATETYKKNFPSATVYLSSVSNIIQEGMKTQSFFADLMHMSNPCQTLSPAHTREGKNDDANSACIFSPEGLLKSVKPRIATLENTSGLESHHADMLGGIIFQFTSVGYSVRWGVVELANWGLPQSRKRLIIIASAPGEVLPTFPRFTHSKDGNNGLKKWVTINDILQRIAIEAPNHLNHDIAAAMYPPDRIKLPFDGNVLAKCITTSGGNNRHPSGTRDYTQLEWQCLNGFPFDHQFVGSKTDIKKQIGNAVPPIIAKIIFSHIRRTLEKFDGVVRQAHSVDD